MEGKSWPFLKAGFIAVAAFVATLIFTSLPLLSFLELKGLDLLFILRGSLPPPAGIVVVAIDEPSFAEISEQWPWPRSLHAQLIDKLKRAGARVIGFDILFAERSQPAEDRALRQAIREAGNVVLVSERAVIDDPLFRHTIRVDPIVPLEDIAAVGSTPLRMDPDGTVRRARLLFPDIPSFALQIARLYLAGRNSHRTERQSPVRKGRMQINPSEEVLINHLGPPRTVKTVSYYQALEYERMLPPGIFADKIVLVGRSLQAVPEPQRMTPDTFRTPYSLIAEGPTPGVEIHATLASNILEGRFVSELSPPARLGLLMLLALVASLMLLKLKPFAGLMATGVLSALFLVVVYATFVIKSLWLPTFAGVVQLSLVYGGHLIDQALSAERQRRVALEELRLKTARLEALIRVSQAITATLDPQRIIQVIVKVVGELTEGIGVRLWHVEEVKKVLIPLGSYGLDTSTLEASHPIPIGQGLVGRVAATRSPLVVEDIRRDPRVIKQDLVEQEGLVSFLGIPLLREEKLLGVLSIMSRTPRCFTQDEIDLFGSFAQQAAIGLENAHLYQDLQHSHHELMAAQAQLVRKTRMAAMGEIAAAVAHETRNPLGALSNCVQLLWKNPHLTGEDAELLDIIRTESQRLNEIVSDFLAFGRPRPPHFQEVDLHELIDETLALVQRDDRCSSSILFSRQFDSFLQKVRADRDQLRQVFWNLLLNAVQAMKEKGTLHVESRNTATGVAVLVRDTGPGIPRTVLANIFEPFYSMRPGGTGLGLAIVRRIVEEHGGQITVDSQEGVGTCFALSLPLSGKASDLQAS